MGNQWILFWSFDGIDRRSKITIFKTTSISSIWFDSSSISSIPHRPIQVHLFNLLGSWWLIRVQIFLHWRLRVASSRVQPRTSYSWYINSFVFNIKTVGKGLGTGLLGIDPVVLQDLRGREVSFPVMGPHGLMVRHTARVLEVPGSSPTVGVCRG